eukprot:351729-Chlamydomonas_euryale.AAC.9
MGIDTSKAVKRLRSQSRGCKRERSAADVPAGEGSEEKERVHSSKSRTMSRGRSGWLAERHPAAARQRRASGCACEMRYEQSAHPTAGSVTVLAVSLC